VPGRRCFSGRLLPRSARVFAFEASAAAISFWSAPMNQRNAEQSFKISTHFIK